jgi:hypothetical protein
MGSVGNQMVVVVVKAILKMTNVILIPDSDRMVSFPTKT